MRTRSIYFPNTRDEMEPLFDKLQRAVTTHLLNAGGLVIKTSGSPTVKTVNTIRYMIDGSCYSLTDGDMAALSGTVVNGTFNVFVFTVNAAGTKKTYMGTAGASLSAVVFPQIPDGEVVIGFVIINPTGTGNFVGGTTALDSGTVVPNAVYVDTPYPFFPELKEL